MSQVTNPVDSNPELAPLRQVSYRESFARRMSGELSPLQPTDADMAVHAAELEDMARAQVNARRRPIDESVER